jgi:tRNA nucleotidyltransferase (CCA-adding enzyme)
VIGGFVRDLILNRDFKRFDIVAVGSGIKLALKVSHYSQNNQKYKFSRHGTACCVFEDTDIEFVEEKNPTILIVGTPL